MMSLLKPENAYQNSLVQFNGYAQWDANNLNLEEGNAYIGEII